MLFLTLKHSFYSREIRNFLEMNFTGATIWKNIFTTNKSTVETTCSSSSGATDAECFDSSLEGVFCLAVKLARYFRNSKAHGVFMECLQFSGMSSVQSLVVSNSFPTP